MVLLVIATVWLLFAVTIISACKAAAAGDEIEIVGGDEPYTHALGGASQ